MSSPQLHNAISNLTHVIPDCNFVRRLFTPQMSESFWKKQLLSSMKSIAWYNLPSAIYGQQRKFKESHNIAKKRSEYKWVHEWRKLILVRTFILELLFNIVSFTEKRICLKLVQVFVCFTCHPRQTCCHIYKTPFMKKSLLRQVLSKWHITYTLL